MISTVLDESFFPWILLITTIDQVQAFRFPLASYSDRHKKTWVPPHRVSYHLLELGRIKSIIVTFLLDYALYCVGPPQRSFSLRILHSLKVLCSELFGCLDSVLWFNIYKRASSWEFDVRSVLLAQAQLSTFGNVFDFGTHFSGMECQENT